jgi:hypothetical protein
VQINSNQGIRIKSRDLSRLAAISISARTDRIVHVRMETVEPVLAAVLRYVRSYLKSNGVLQFDNRALNWPTRAVEYSAPDMPPLCSCNSREQQQSAQQDERSD